MIFYKKIKNIKIGEKKLETQIYEIIIVKFKFHQVILYIFLMHVINWFEISILKSFA